MRLTDEQSKIVEENHDLIYSYIHQNKLDVDEWYGVFAIELCEAVIKHDPKRGELSTLFYTMCRNKRFHMHRHNKARKRDGGNVLSLDWEYRDCENGKNNLGDILEDESVDIEDSTRANEIYQELISGEHGEIFRLKAMGYNQREIAKKVGFSQAHVSRVIIKVGEEYLNDR